MADAYTESHSRRQRGAVQGQFNFPTWSDRNCWHHFSRVQLLLFMLLMHLVNNLIDA